jgi:chromosome segregation ATPase
MSRYNEDHYEEPRRSTATLRGYESTLYSPAPVDKSLHKVELKLKAQRGSVNLNLGDAFIGDEGCEPLAQHLKDHPEITTLDLKGNNISVAGLRILAPALRHSKLRSLSLEWNAIGNDTDVLAEAFGFSDTLQSLDLRNNRIGVQGAEHLAKLISVNKSLVTLDLRWNELGTQGAAGLLEALQGRHSVRRVEVSGNRIPDDLLSQFEDPTVGAISTAQKSPRTYSPLRYSKASPLKASTESYVPVKMLSREKEYTDELQAKYEGQLLALTRAESRISELELMLEQEVKRSQDARQELLRDLESERYQRNRTEEALLVLKEDSLKHEMDDSRTLQELELRLNRAQSEKTMLSNELDRLHASYDQLQSTSSERVRALDERLAQQQKAYRQLEDSARLSSERARDEHFSEVRDVTAAYESKLGEAQQQLEVLAKEKESVEVAVQSLKNQMFDLKSLHAEELIRTEDHVREEEGIKFNSALRNLETRMKAGEEAREQLSRRNQELQRELARTEKKASDTSYLLESQLSQEKDSRDEVTRQLHTTSAALENTRSELHLSKAALDRLQLEKEELSRTLAQRKDQHNKLVEKLYSEQANERRQAEIARKDLESRISELEGHLSQAEQERDHFLGAHSRLAEVLKAELSQCIQDTVQAHAKQLEASTYR